jgi:hypothetical protein
MLDPRLYRAALAGVVLAVIVCAFSLSAQPAPVRTTLAPDAFTGARADQELDDLAARYPRRRPGDVQDELLARQDRRHVPLDLRRGSTCASRACAGRPRWASATSRR